VNPYLLRAIPEPRRMEGERLKKADIEKKGAKAWMRGGKGGRGMSIMVVAI